MSDEFTPTTEQVRDGYRYDPEAEWRDPITPHHIINGRAFDRWLAAHDRVVAANAWDEGWIKGAESERLSFGRKVSWAPKSNPYRITEENN